MSLALIFPSEYDNIFNIKLLFFKLEFFILLVLYSLCLVKNGSHLLSAVGYKFFSIFLIISLLILKIFFYNFSVNTF